MPRKTKEEEIREYLQKIGSRGGSVTGTKKGFASTKDPKARKARARAAAHARWAKVNGEA